MKIQNTITPITDINLSQAAKLGGFGLLFMFIFGLFGSGPDSTSKFEDFLNPTNGLSTQITCDFMMLVCDVIAAAGVFAFLKPVNQTLSLLAAWFRLMHVAIYSTVLLTLLLTLKLLGGSDAFSALGNDQLEALGMLLLHGHEYGFFIGLLFFGFHFLLVGYLILKSTYVPKIIGIVWLIVSVGYIVNSLLNFLWPNFEIYRNTAQFIVFIPAIVAELSFCLWLLFKGSKIKAYSYREEE